MPDNIQEMAQDMYDVALENGYSKKDAQYFSLKKVEYNMKYPIDEYEHEIFLRRQMLVEYFGELFNQHREIQANTLWDFGFNTRAKHWWLDVCLYRDGNQIKVGEFVCGEERTDKEWISDKNNSSFQAQVRGKGDPSLHHELRRMSGGKMYE